MRIALVALLAVTSAAAQQTPKPDNAARQALIDSLDKLAAEHTAARRAEIAKIQTLAQAKARQTKVRATMLRLLGPLPAKTPLDAKILGETPFDTFRIQKILFDSQPSFHVTALLYLPNSVPKEKLPAIVMAPGHGATGKASDFAFAAAFARNGFAVLSYDPIGQGERLQYPDPKEPGKSLATRPTGEHAEASLQPILLGESLGKYMLWDGIRAVDYLQTRAEIDPSRIGAFGCSGGGAMTALLGALDTRIAATATACYITSFDTLLPSIGPQDGEQSTPGWIAAGLDFPDWIELAAPRPYAVLSTAADMFPYAGALASVTEARRFYSLFNPKTLSSFAAGGGPASPPITGPTLNPDTAATVPANSPLQWIVGTGGHGNLRPLQPQILAFFQTHLMPGAPPSATASSSIRVGSTDPQNQAQGREIPPPAALQVTTTGQVATSYPNSATVFSLNLADAKTLALPHPITLSTLQEEIHTLTGATAKPGAPLPAPHAATLKELCSGYSAYGIQTPSGVGYKSALGTRFPAILFLIEEPDLNYCGSGPGSPSDKHKFEIVAQHKVAMNLTPTPAPAGTEDQKSPILGDFYMLNLRAELVGKTLLGLRIDDVIRAVDLLTHDPETDPTQISAEASGHEALVLLHAAVLDPRLKHITLHNLLPSYAALLADPLPHDAPEDLIPGVLLHYDIPDLLRALGARVTLEP